MAQAERFGELKNKLNTSPEARQRYCARVRADMPLRPFWWESIRLEEELP
jgi:hypothetical protein